jgi:hypothetical protein
MKNKKHKKTLSFESVFLIKVGDYFKLPTMSSGFTHASKSSGETYPKRTASSFRVVPFL